MKRILQVLTVLVGVTFFSGCSTAAHKSFAKKQTPAAAGSAGFARDGMTFAQSKSAPAEAQLDRMITWTASLSIDVWDVSNAVARTCAMVEQQGGFVDSRSNIKESSASLHLRVPAKIFTAAVADLESLGTVTGRNVSADDVTEQYVDVEARLKNKIVLRDRLQQLLDKAVNVKDVLAIESELNRVQSDIDSMEARIKSLKGRVEYASIYLTFDRKPVPGPVGVVLKGIGWGIKKLFVLRE